MATAQTIKTEGFAYPNMMPRPVQRPDFRRPFSDGSMTIPTSDLAASLPNPPTFMNSFSYAQTTDPYFSPFNYNVDILPLSPHQPQLSLQTQPQSLPTTLPLSQPQPTPQPQSQSQPQPQPPPVTLPQTMEERDARSLSRGSIGKVKAPRSRSGRKGSVTDIKPIIGRVRTASARAMSYSHPDGRLGLGLDTHVEHQRTDSVSPPDFTYGLPANSWSASGSLPSMQSFGTTIDEAFLDSPISPTSHLPPLPLDASDEVRKQRRRECHNLVEKRRREHINNKIDELAHLLPPQYEQQMEEMAIEEDMEEDEQGSPKGKKKTRRNSAMVKTKELAHCKGRILTHSVQYIHDLRQVNEIQASRIQQLEALLNGRNFPAAPVLSTPQSFFEAQGLQALRPSPEPEPFSQDWNFNPVFEASPDDLENSSGSASIMDHPIQSRGRQDSMQMAMSSMELEHVFGQRQREEDMVMRW